MKPLVSILLPTRNQHSWLFKCLSSIKNTCSDLSKIEILLRMDIDDNERIALIPSLAEQFPIRILIGPRGTGYGGSGHYFCELARVAEGDWVWQFDDDFWIEGSTWLASLGAIPCNPYLGPAVHAEFYQLGGSRYNNATSAGCVGLITPAQFYRSLGEIHPGDQPVWDEIRKINWKVELLRGTTLCHEGRAR